MSEPYSKSSRNSTKVQNPEYEIFAGSNANSGDFSSDPSYTILRWTDSLSGIKQPKWKKLIKMRANAGTPMTATRRDVVTLTPADVTWTGNVDNPPTSAGRRKFRARGIFCSPGVMPTAAGVPTGSAASQAAGSWYKQVSRAYSSFKGQVFAGESREARAMMSNRARRMLAGVNPFTDRAKRRWYGRGSTRAKVKWLSDAWLELQYGWLPLANDIKSAYKTLQNPKLQTEYISAYGSHTSSTVLADVLNGVPNASFMERRVEKTEYSVKYYGVVQCYEFPSVDRLSNFGLTRNELASTAWELIPWSFLIDYFTNVGDIVNAMGYASTSVAWASQSARSKRTYSAFTYDWKMPGVTTIKSNRVISASPDRVEFSASQVIRSPIVSVPVPNLTFQIPTPKQILNISALVISKKLRIFNVPL